MNEELTAFVIGAGVFVIAVVLFIQAFFPSMMQVPLPKLIWIVILIVGGVLGVAVKNWMKG